MAFYFGSEVRHLDEDAGDWACDLHKCMILFGAGRDEASSDSWLTMAAIRLL